MELSYNKFTKEDAKIIRGLVFFCPDSCFGPKRSFHLDAKSKWNDRFGPKQELFWLSQNVSKVTYLHFSTILV